MHIPGVVDVEKWVDNENVTAIVAAWMPGQESGNSLVDVLYGDVNPSGKLPFTWGKSEDDYPVCYSPLPPYSSTRSDTRLSYSLTPSWMTLSSNPSPTSPRVSSSTTVGSIARTSLPAMVCALVVPILAAKFIDNLRRIRLWSFIHHFRVL